MSSTIRKAKKEDFPVLRMLWQFYEYHNSYYTHEDIDHNGLFDIDDDYIMATLEAKEECEVYLILSDQSVAGFLTIEPVEIRGKELLELADLFILPKYRSRGVASFAIKNMVFREDKAWHISVYQGDTLALAFWKRIFHKLPFRSVSEISPPEVEGFYEFVVEAVAL
ncbi:GNAT family N-acetyltransferase [Hahella aquimaris]|uniref:GNAT family N-acetyltransferase n=1 Tax=Hahella sp. HNIBRBA332 TaxID=3015983 RepID=UPI00273B2129|nr:GNAT family N-acetyltransferase [Hahella sp. HNIBRBA332]WLQ13254.1 GNAT family N-acetyltransferase [Hahella sp. HNIBRBA332]